MDIVKRAPELSNKLSWMSSTAGTAVVGDQRKDRKRVYHVLKRRSRANEHGRELEWSKAGSRRRDTRARRILTFFL
jgi:hypothetical protein